MQEYFDRCFIKRTAAGRWLLGLNKRWSISARGRWNRRYWRYSDCRGRGVTATDFERDVPIVPASVLLIKTPPWTIPKTPSSLSQALSGGPKCPSSTPPLCQRGREVNRGLLADDLEPIDCQSQQIAIVPPWHSTSSSLPLPLLNSFATITCCHVGLCNSLQFYNRGSQNLSSR